MLYHCNCKGIHSYSLHLLNWNYCNEQQWCVDVLDNGTKSHFNRRETPYGLYLVIKI